MKEKNKACFTPHAMMHSLIGLGLGIVVASLWTGVAKWWIGVIVIAVGVVLDMMRKA